MYKNTENKVPKKVAVHTSFFEVIAIGESQHKLLSKKVAAYNATLPQNVIKDSLGRTRAYTKGKIAHGAINLARKLIYLCAKQMEELRTSPQNDKYLNYLDENSDSYPITTNNGKLAKALGSIRCKNTIHNYINQLIEAGVILKKNNTSRRKREVTSENGYKTIVVDLMPNGRGDFCLWLSKEIFAQKYRYLNVENSPTEALKQLPVDLSPQSENNANTGLSDNQIQKLGQCYTPKTETNKIIINNCLENSEYGAAMQQEVVSPTSDEVELEDRNEQNKKNPTKNQGSQARPSRKERYRIRIERNKAAKKVLKHENGIEYYSKILCFQLFQQLYPQLSRSYQKQIQEKVEQMLLLHIERLIPHIPKKKRSKGKIAEYAEPAYYKLSRAIYLAHRFIQTHEGAFVYEPLTYLRIDGQYTKGTLMYVVDKWVKEEADRLKLNAKGHSHLINWQGSHLLAEKLFSEVIVNLQTSKTTATAKFKEGLSKLEAYFSKYEIAEKTRIRVKRAFTDRCLAIFQELQNSAQEEADPIWKNFQQFKKIINQ